MLQPTYRRPRPDQAGFSPGGLPGPLALWKFDEGSGLVAKNAWAGSPNPGTNLCPAPEQAFSDQTALAWRASGAPTVTEGYAANPDGHQTATRLQFPAGANQFMYLYTNQAAATYTISAYFKSNTGTIQNVQFSANWSGVWHFQGAQAVAADGNWYRLSATFTAAATLLAVGVGSDGTNASDVSCWGVQLEAGSSVSAYRRQTLDMLLAPGGTGATTTTPTWGATGLTFANSGHAIALHDNPPALTTPTVYLLFKQTSAPTATCYGVADRNNFTSLSITGEADPTLYVGGAGGQVGAQSATGLSHIADGNWHVLAVTSDNTNTLTYLDGIPYARTTGTVPGTGAPTGWTSKGFRLGFPTSSMPGVYGACAVYSQNHSLSQIRQMTTWLSHLALTRGITTYSPSTYLVFEGDSLLQGGHADGPADEVAPVAMRPFGTTIQWSNFAYSASRLGVAGDTNSLNVRAPEDDAALLPTRAKSVLFVEIFANDVLFHNFGAGLDYPTTADYVAALKTYCQARTAAGWSVVLGTALPNNSASGGSSGETLAAGVNSGIRADPSFYLFLADWGADATMGAAGAENDTHLYVDGVHPGTFGDLLIGCITYSALNAAVNGLAAAAPAAPASPAAVTGASTGQVTVSWTASTGSPDWYDVEMSPDGSTNWLVLTRTYSTSATVDGTTRGSAMVSATTYFFRVRAFNQKGFSAYTANVSAAAK